MDESIESLMAEDGDISLLYVEDNDFVRESTLDLLQLYFDDITVAVDGQDAIEKYDAYYQKNGTYFDIVLTDIKMPRLNGIELIEAIRERNERQIVVVISAHDDADHLMKLIELEVSKFLTKPIDTARFEKVFADAIGIIHQKRRFKQVNEQMAHAKEVAEHAAELKSRFLANMSHEIRTPLNAIIGFISLLREQETDPTKRKYLNIIKNSSDSLLQIINDILDFSKIESGKLSIEPTVFDPYKDLVDISELFQAKASEKNIDLHVKYNDDMPKALYADILRIRQIYTNLLSNAIKFTPQGGRVKSVIYYKNGQLVIRVKDYGIGIGKEKQKAIFKPFMQADGSTQRLYGGTGLGLSISLELAKLLGGDLTLQSKEGKGSTFTLKVPVTVEEPVPEVGIKPISDESAAMQGHVLIVEDYEANRMYVGVILDNAGITYDTACDGLEAIEKFKNGTYDVILMDENMPNMGGTDAARKILAIEKEKSKRHTPIVVLTANALQGDKERFLDAGFDDYLSKPVDPKTLLSTLRKYLDR